ncbi:MAG: hypothetical protein K2P70_09390 [Hyphomonadaceae bacterium]|nr:hypothetical protein [Hyphomonadaceae bacterium]
MPLADLAAQDREVIRRAMEATFQFFDWDFQTRLGITPDAMRGLLDSWPNVDDTPDDSDACLAINNALNDLLGGVGISDQKAMELIGVERAEMLRVYRAWAEGRGWSSTGVR